MIKRLCFYPGKLLKKNTVSSWVTRNGGHLYKAVFATGGRDYSNQNAKKLPQIQKNSCSSSVANTGLHKCPPPLRAQEDTILLLMAIFSAANVCLHSVCGFALDSQNNLTARAVYVEYFMIEVILLWSSCELHFPQEKVWFDYVSLGCRLRLLQRDLRSGKNIHEQQFYFLGHKMNLQKFVINLSAIKQYLKGSPFFRAIFSHLQYKIVSQSRCILLLFV